MRWFSRGSFLSQVTTLVTGTAAAHLIALATLPAVTRLFTPTEMGMVAVFIAFCSFWSRGSALRYESAVLIAQDEADVMRLVGLCFVALTCTSAAAPVILALLIDRRVLGFEILPVSAAWVAALTLLGLASFAVLRAWRIRDAKFRLVSRATVTRAAAYAATRIGAGALGYGLGGLLAAEVVAAWASLPTVGRGLGSQMYRSLPSLGPRSLIDIGRKYAKFPRYEFPSVLLEALANALPVPLVSALYGANSAGLFALAFRVVGAPNMQIGFAVADVFQARFADHLRAGRRAAARSMFLAALRKLALVALLPLVAMMALAPPLMGIVFGSEWQDAGWIAAVMAPWMYAAFVVASLSRVVSLVERQELKLIYDTAALAAVALVYFAARTYALSLLQMTVALAAARGGTYVIYLLILLHAIKSHAAKAAP